MKAVSRAAIGMLVGLAAVAGYLVAAIHLEQSYVDPRPAGRWVVVLSPPFEPSGDYVAKYGITGEPGLTLFEDKMELRPLGDTDAQRGPGRFRFTPQGIVFSSSDLSDPNAGKHRYWLVIK